MNNLYRPTLQTGLETAVFALLTNSLGTKTFQLTKGADRGVHLQLSFRTPRAAGPVSQR